MKVACVFGCRDIGQFRTVEVEDLRLSSSQESWTFLDRFGIVWVIVHSCSEEQERDRPVLEPYLAVQTS